MINIRTKDELLDKLRSYAIVPDEETIQYKEKIKNALFYCPELLYAINNAELESELFNEDGTLNVDENGEPLGEWDRYFGDNSNIRPFLFIPETQDEVRNFVCYQVEFEKLPNKRQKYTTITFTILVNGDDSIDKSTGIPRHDLIASIIRERFNWSNIFGMQTSLISNQESVTDNDYLVRTLIFQLVDTNGIATTNNGITNITNYLYRK